MMYVGETGASWHKRQVGITFRLYIYDKGNKNEKVTPKYFFYDIGTSP